MKILVTGGRGMLGADLVGVLSATHAVTTIDLVDGDLTDPLIATALIERNAPEWVIHCAAYTDVDGAESHPDQARAINVDATRNVAVACAASGARMVQLSTDYVFAGDKDGPYLPDDRPDPLGVYGRTKRDAELAAIEALGDRALVLRTAWLYGPSGRNFVDAILRQLDDGRPLRVVSDQIGAPTYTVYLGQAIAAAIAADLRGVHHATAAGSCSWHRFAREICRLSGFMGWPIEPISAAQLGRPAPRPANSRLDTSSFRRATGYRMPDWPVGLAAYLKRIGRLVAPEATAD